MLNTQLADKLECLMVKCESARLNGLHGISGMQSLETFRDLHGILEETGFADVRPHMAKLRRQHAVAVYRVKRALPIAVDAMRLQEMGGLEGFFDKIKKAVKKVAKVATKLSLSHAVAKKLKIDKFSPSQMLASKIDPAKPKAPKTQQQIDDAAAAKAAKALAKQAKKDAKAAVKAAAALAKAGAENLPPVAAGAAVLADQSGMNFSSPAGQQFAQEAVQQADAADEAGDIFGLPWPLAAGIGAAGVGILWLAFGGKKRH